MDKVQSNNKGEKKLCDTLGYKVYVKGIKNEDNIQKEHLYRLDKQKALELFNKGIVAII